MEALRSSLHELEGLLKQYAPLMSGLREKSVGREIIYSTVFAEVRFAIFTPKKQDLDITQLQRRFWVLPVSRLRFVLALCKSEAKVTLEGLDVKGTEQV